MDPGRLGAIRAPVMLLVGGNSPDTFKATNRRVHEALPHSQLVELRGHQHVAMDIDPKAFAGTLLAFMRGDAAAAARLASGGG